MNDPLIEFVLACFGEDEAVAKFAGGGHWHDTAPLRQKLEDGGFNRADIEHMLRHDPARVLAECAAKRQILADHESTPYWGLDRYGRWLPHEGEPKTYWCKCQTDEWGNNTGGEEPCRTKRILASVYSDRPGYQPEWGDPV